MVAAFKTACEKVPLPCAVCASLSSFFCRWSVGLVRSVRFFVRQTPRGGKKKRWKENQEQEDFKEIAEAEVDVTNVASLATSLVSAPNQAGLPEDKEEDKAAEADVTNAASLATSLVNALKATVAVVMVVVMVAVTEGVDSKVVPVDSMAVMVEAVMAVAVTMVVMEVDIRAVSGAVTNKEGLVGDLAVRAAVTVVVVVPTRETDLVTDVESSVTLPESALTLNPLATTVATLATLLVIVPPTLPSATGVGTAVITRVIAPKLRFVGILVEVFGRFERGEAFFLLFPCA